MTRTPLAASAAILVALLLAMVVAPATLAADPGAGEPVATEGAATPAPDATDAPAPTPTLDDGNGEIVIDPTFVTPDATPVGQVRGATGRPDTAQRTPPATDAAAAPVGGHAGLPLVLWIVGAGSALALLAGRAPAARRR